MNKDLRKFRNMQEFRSAPDIYDYVMKCIDDVLSYGKFDEFSAKYRDFTEYVIQYAEEHFVCREPTTSKQQQCSESSPEKILQRYLQMFEQGWDMFKMEMEINNAATSVQDDQVMVGLLKKMAYDALSE